MSEMDYKKRIKTLRTEFDPAAWTKMNELLKEQSGAAPVARPLGRVYFIVAAALVTGVAIWWGINTFQGNDSAPVGTEQSPVEQSAEGKEESNQPNEAQNEPVSEPSDEEKEPINGSDEDAPQRQSIDTPKESLKAETSQKSKIRDLGVVVKTRPSGQSDSKTQTDEVLIPTPQPMDAAPADQQVGALSLQDWSSLIQIPSADLGNVPLANGAKKDSIPPYRWKWFVSGGFLTGFGVNNLGAGFSFSGGKYLGRNFFFQTGISSTSVDFGFTQLIGQGKVKPALEGKVHLTSGLAGPALGVGAYYDLVDGMRFYSMIHVYEHFGEAELELFQLQVGAQFDLTRNRGRAVDGYYYRKRQKPFSFDASNVGDDQWRWMGYAFIAPGHIFGDHGIAGLGVARYINESSFLQLGTKFGLEGYSPDPRGTRTDFRFHLSYNRELEIGKTNWIAQGGLLVNPTSQNFWSAEYRPGIVQINIGFGPTFRISEKMRLFLIPNLDDPFSTIQLSRRLSFQLGTQFRLK